MPGSILTIKEMAQEHQARCAQEARRLYKAAVRPFYRGLPDGRPQGIASCTLLEIDGVRCLATAAHVLDGHDQASLHLGGAPDIIPLNCNFSASIPPDGNRANDNVDVAVALLQGPLIEKLKDFPFIPLSAQIADVQPRATNIYLAMGYRSSQNPAPFRGVSELTPKIFTFASSPGAVPNATQRLNAGSYNFAIEYPKKAQRAGGEIVRTTPPAGMSGGAIFELGDLANAEQIASSKPNPPKLAGIVIECSRSARVLLGTKIRALYECYRDAKSG